MGNTIGIITMTSWWAEMAVEPMENRSKSNYSNGGYGIKLFHQTIFFHFKIKATMAVFHHE